MKLFEKDYSPLVCKVFRKKCKLTQKDEEIIETQEEKFATKVGADEIDGMRSELAKAIENIRKFALSPEVIQQLLEIDAQLVSSKKILLWEFDPLKVIASEGKEAYLTLIAARKDWIEEIINQYEDNGMDYK